MTDATQAAAMVERLLREVDSGRRTDGGASLSTDGKWEMWGSEPIMVLANPDGPAAAAIIGELLAEWEKKREALETLSGILEAAPELNPSNYDHEQVCELNAKMVEACLFYRAAIDGGEQ